MKTTPAQREVVTEEAKFDPQELCPLIKAADAKLCQSASEIDPKELCPLIQALDAKLCQSEAMEGDLEGANGKTLDLSWSDCGDAETHAKVTSLTPKTLTLGEETHILGTGALDEDVSDGSYTLSVKAGPGGIISKTCKGDIGKKAECPLPLGLGALTWDGLTLPLAKGPAIKVGTTVKLSGSIPTSMAKSTIKIEATEGNGRKLICLQVKTTPAATLLVV